MTTAPHAAGDLLFVEPREEFPGCSLMEVAKLSRSGAWALARKIGSKIPGMGVRVLRSRYEAYVLDPAKQFDALTPANEPEAEEPAATPRARRPRSGTRRACAEGAIVAHGLTLEQMQARTGTGRKRH